MSKRIIISTLALAAGIVLILSCRRKVEERPFFPAAEYYTPTEVAPGAQLEIHGAVLDGSKVKIDGKTAAVDSVSKSGNIIYVKVPSDLSVGTSYTVEVEYNENESFVFTPKLKIAAATTTVKELLIGDFDGGGVRAAIATSDFSNGQWSGNAGANSVIGIGNDVNGVPSSPAGGNYAFGTVFGGGVLPNTFGFVATINSRSGLQNDLVTDWPLNFFEYPGSVLDIENNDLREYYINFLVNFNDTPKSQLRIFIGNAKLPKAERFAVTIRPGSNYPVTGWQQVSISLNKFRDNFGNTNFLDFETFLEQNQIYFDLTDSFENNYSSNVGGQQCCVGNVSDCCATAIKDPVQIYIDQIVISQGGTAPSIQ